MHELDRGQAGALGGDRGAGEHPVEHHHVRRPALQQIGALVADVADEREQGVPERSHPGAEAGACLPVAQRVGLAVRDVEVRARSPELDELRAGSLDPLARGAMREHSHLVAALEEPARDGELRRRVAAESHQCLEDAHAKINFTQYQMKVSAPSLKKRPYRMSARADGAAATRERLLAAAWRYFSTRPYEDVRLSEIAAEAEVTAQTLHTNFGSKEQLFTTVAIRWGREEMAQRDEAPVGDVREAIEILFDRYEANGITVLRMLSEEERIPAVRRITDAGRAYHRDWVARTFQPLLHGLRGRARARRLAAIVVATDLLVWKLLRQDMQLDRESSEQIVAEMIQSLPPAR